MMKSKVYTIRTPERECFVEITQYLRKYLSEINVSDGVLHVSVPHTTAGVTINEHADPSVVRDILVHLKKLVPYHGDYEHLEGNSDAHIKACLVGSSLSIPFESNRLLLGTWQGVFFCEFDGPRTRRFIVTVLPCVLEKEL